MALHLSSESSNKGLYNYTLQESFKKHLFLFILLNFTKVHRRVIFKLGERVVLGN